MGNYENCVKLALNNNLVKEAKDYAKKQLDDDK
jgi:hypothetical protein